MGYKIIIACYSAVKHVLINLVIIYRENHGFWKYEYKVETKSGENQLYQRQLCQGLRCGRLEDYILHAN